MHNRYMLVPVVGTKQTFWSWINVIEFEQSSKV